MVKVSITLPNNAQITFESEEAEVIHEVVSMVLRDLPRDLMYSATPEPGENSTHARTSKGNGVAEASPGVSPAGFKVQEVVGALSPLPVAPPAPVAPVAAPPQAAGPESGTRDREPSPPPNLGASPVVETTARPLTEAEQAFVSFCHKADPLGDMRRVVVAAEGASRYLGRASVDAEDLGRLFDLAGWPRAHSFVQTLRNAGRSKFRWLERIPGRSGHYRVTDRGRATALDQ